MTRPSKLVPAALAVLAATVVAVSGCSASTTTADASNTATSRTDTASPTSSSAAPSFSLSTAPKNPFHVGAQVQMSWEYGTGESTVWVKATPLSAPTSPWVDGAARPATMVAFKVQLYADDTHAVYFASDDGGLRLSPSSGGSAFYGTKDMLTASNQAMAQSACHGLQLMDQVIGQRGEYDGYNLTPGVSYIGCIVFDFFGKAHPETMTYEDKDDGFYTQPVWGGNLPRTSIAKADPVALGSYSGSSSEIVHLSKQIRRSVYVRMCWTMGSGNHILEAEDDQSGYGMNVILNTVGGSAHGCQFDPEPQPYVQIITESYWTLKFTGYPSATK